MSTQDLDRYWNLLESMLPSFTSDERTAAVTLYRELAKGEPVAVPQLAEALGVSKSRVEELLERPAIKAFTYPDDEGRVVGFGGLAAAEMPHRLRLDGRTMWTWCAWDSLFIPEILGEGAEVESKDPRTGRPIRLRAGPKGVTAREPDTVVVSFVAADAEMFNRSAENVMASFCHYVFFFESEESGTAWAAEHDGTFIMSLDDAMDLAHRLNARTWGDALTRTARESGARS